MIPIHPAVIPEDAELIIFAKEQPEYIPLPAVNFPKEGCILTEWKPSEEELKALICGEHIKLWIWNFNRPLQPVMIEVTSEK